MTPVALLAIAMTAVADGVVVFDPAERIALVNPRVAALFRFVRCAFRQVASHRS